MKTLIGSTYVCSDCTWGVLDADPGDTTVQEFLDKLKRELLLWLDVGPPPRVGGGEVLARWEGDEEVPSLLQEVPNVTQVVQSWLVALDQVRRPGIMTLPTESVAYPA